MKINLSIFLLSFSCVCFSQSIPAPTVPASGAEFSVNTTTTIASNIPVDGGWNFSKVVTTAQPKFKLLPASTSNLAKDFPLATHVRMSGNDVEAFVAYDGSKYKFCGMPFMLYPTPLVMHTWPLSVEYSHVDSVFMKFPGPGGVTINREDKSVVTGVSSGTLTLPNGAVYKNALLVKVMRTFDDRPPNSLITYKTTLNMYHWWVEGYPVPLVETRAQTNPNDPTSYKSTTFRTPIPPLPPVLQVKRSGEEITLTYTGNLQASAVPSGPFTNLVGIKSPYAIQLPIYDSLFFRSIR